MRAHRQRRTRPFPAGSRWRSRARLAAREPGRESRRDAAAARPPPPSHQRPLPGPLRWRCGPHRCGARRGGSRCAPAGTRAGRDAGARPARGWRAPAPIRRDSARPVREAPRRPRARSRQAQWRRPPPGHGPDCRATAIRAPWQRPGQRGQDGGGQRPRAASQPRAHFLPGPEAARARAGYLRCCPQPCGALRRPRARPRGRRARLPPRRPLAPAGRLARAAYRPRMQERSRGPEESVGGSSPWVETVHARPAVAEAHGNSRG